jgi:hypothetical protein
LGRRGFVVILAFLVTVVVFMGVELNGTTKDPKNAV